MKLYNLYEEIILEETKKHFQIISEGVSGNEVVSAIDGKYNVNILYRDSKNAPPSKRYIQTYVYGKLDNGNYAIRAYQIFGGSKTTPSTGAWKIFRLDRIEGWYPTNMKWNKPVSDYGAVGAYNDNGDMKGNLIKGQKVNTFATIIKQYKPEAPVNNVEKQEI